MASEQYTLKESILKKTLCLDLRYAGTGGAGSFITASQSQKSHAIIASKKNCTNERAEKNWDRDNKDLMKEILMAKSL